MDVQTNPVKRSVRTGVQSGAAGLIILAIDLFNIYDFNEEQATVAVLILTPVLSFIQNLVENRVGNGLLRPQTSDEPVVPL